MKRARARERQSERERARDGVRHFRAFLDSYREVSPLLQHPCLHETTDRGLSQLSVGRNMGGGRAGGGGRPGEMISCLTTKSQVVVQSTLLTPSCRPVNFTDSNCFTAALPSRGSRDPPRLLRPYAGARHCTGCCLSRASGGTWGEGALVEGVARQR